MGYTHYDRLSALDAAFLEVEGHVTHMHVGTVSIFEAGRLRTPDGALDIERIRDAAFPILRSSPRLRQRLAYVPLLGHPVWVDDPSFNLNYHLRHTALPEPGDERLLKRLAGRIFSQQLDRGKPLWEMWFVESLEGDRFAVISKFHHAMLDGISGVDLLSALAGEEPEPPAESERRWLPRPAPQGTQLLADELARRASAPWKLLRGTARALSRPREALELARDAAEAMGETAARSLFPASPTPLNPDIGPHRRFDWTRIELDAANEVKNRLGGTVNDVVLATASGALRRFLRGHGLRVADLDFRAMITVNVGGEDEQGELGNRVPFRVVRLPLAESNPRRRLARVTETTRALEASKETLGDELLETIADCTAPKLVAAYARFGGLSRTYNTVIANVPGPASSMRLLGARLLEIYPEVPLYTSQALSVAFFRYERHLFWGFNSDWDAMPDLHDLVDAVHAEFESLTKAAAKASRRS
jgi:WS/DGAT/MGAT family acyltransferase